MTTQHDLSPRNKAYNPHQYESNTWGLLFFTIALLVSLLLFGCGSRVTNYPLSAMPSGLNVVRHQDFWGTVYTAVVITEEGKAAFPPLQRGTSPAEFTASMTGWVVIGGVGAYVGTMLPKAGGGASTVTVTGVPEGIP